MEHASRCVEDKNLKAALDDDESHSGGIGTPATRADTIEKLVRSKLVERKGRQLHATTEGERLTDVVEPRLKDVLLTARMEQALSDVEHGKRGPSEVMDMFHREALRIPADATANLKADAVTRTANTDAQEWGDCPRCGQPVRKTGRMWQCSTNKTEKTKDGKWATTAGCGWKMYARIAGKTITDQTARRLLAGQSVTLKGFTSKSGKKFDAAIRIDQGTRHGVRLRPLTKRQPSVPDAPCRAGHGNDQGDDATMRRYSHAFRVLMDQELFNLLAEASTKTGIPKSRFVRYAIQPFSYTELAPGTTDWNDVYRTDPDPEHPLKRGRQLNVMLTGDEYEMLCRAAFKLGIARSAWVRERVYALLCRSYADELSPLTDASIRDNATMLLKELKTKDAGR